MAFVGVMFGCYELGMQTGREQAVKQIMESDLWQNAKPRERKKWPSFKTKSNLGDLLDPISPDEQRLERILESTKSRKEDDVDGE